MAKRRQAPGLGICALCEGRKTLRGSHFLPAGAYRRLRDEGSDTPDPIIVGRRRTLQTSRQAAAKALCADCEERFNRNGENYAMQWCWGMQGSRFPLMERINVAEPLRSGGAAVAYSSTAIGVDTDQFAYFALSLLWRASIRAWDMPDGTKSTVINVGRHQEPVRMYLLGGPFPDDLIVTMTVTTDLLSQRWMSPPTVVTENVFKPIGIMMLGLDFRILLGPPLPAGARSICCVQSPLKVLFAGDRSQNARQAYLQLAKTSAPAKGLRNRAARTR